MKHFITSIAQQENLNAVNYKNAENVDFLENDALFTHPILIPINNLAEKGEKIRVTALVTQNPDGFVKRNFETFKKELDVLQKKNGFILDEVEEIEVEYEESLKKHLGCFEDLIENISDGEEITADLTYGNKPTPIAVQLALTYSYLFGGNTVVKALIYGELMHGIKDENGNKIGKVFNVSSLFYMNTIMAQMNVTKPAEPLKFIKMILGSEGEDGE